ncbi:MAG: hydrogenase maturation protease [Candidatus Heimdallarchaeota archaeon]
MKLKFKGSKFFKKIDPTKKICIMGIGNFDRADDAAGIEVIEKLEKIKLPDNIFLINAGPVPEAFTGVIKKQEPDILIIIDAAMMDEKPGTIRVFTEKDVDDAYMVTPHKVSMTMYMTYLKNYLKNLKAYFIGIQPGNLSYMESITEETEKSIEDLVPFLADFFKKD